MQKKVLSAVLSLFLVGSASSAFAGYYDIDITKSLDIKDSFKDQSDDDGLDLDVTKSFNGNDNDGLDLDITKSSSVKYDVDVTEEKSVKVNAQGNLVGGKFVIQQFGKGGAASGGDVYTVDNSINGSKINSYNDTNSHNSTYSSDHNHSYTSNVNNSWNTTSKTSHRLGIDVDVNVDKSQSFKAVNSFNRNRLGGRR